MTGPSLNVYACGFPRTTTPLSDLHRKEVHQPVDLRAAVRIVLRTGTHKLMLALAYLNGHAKHPLTITESGGRRFLHDGHHGRIFEIAAAIEHIEGYGLDSRVVQVLRGGYLSDEEAFAVLTSGMTLTEAHRFWMDPDELPPMAALLTMAALRGFTVSTSGRPA